MGGVVISLVLARARCRPNLRLHRRLATSKKTNRQRGQPMTELAEPQSRAGNHGRVEGEPQKPGTMHGADRCEADSKWRH